MDLRFLCFSFQQSMYNLYTASFSQLGIADYARVPAILLLLSAYWGLRSRYDWRSVSQYVLASSPSWDLRPVINSVWILLSCLCWAPFLTRGRVCLLSVTVSNNCPSSSFTFFGLLLSFFFSHFTRHTFYVYTIYVRPSQPRLNTADHIPSSVAYTTRYWHWFATSCVWYWVLFR
jgi:hypothetical protein